MKQRCPKCGEKTDALYSPDWLCINCIPKEQLAQYPAITYLTHTPANGHNLRALKPYQIVSLLHMLKFHAQKFVLIMDNLRLISEIADKRSGEEVSDIDKKELLVNLSDALRMCRTSGLQFSAMYLERHMGYFDKSPSYDSLNEEVGIVIARIHDELGSDLFLQLPSDKAKYFHEEALFGSEVSNKFAKTTEDVQEGGKCFAVARYTACVFHLMRVMEFAVQYLGKRLNISLVNEKNWHNILDEVDKAIKALPTKNSYQKARRNRFAEASAHLRMVKDAWRNDVMHPKETYTEEEAERVFRNVKDFMVHLATKL